MREFHALCVKFTRSDPSQGRYPPHAQPENAHENRMGGDPFSHTAALHVDFGSVVGGRYDGTLWHVFCERKGSQNQKLRMK